MAGFASSIVSGGCVRMPGDIFKRPSILDIILNLRRPTNEPDFPPRRRTPSPPRRRTPSPSPERNRRSNKSSSSDSENEKQRERLKNENEKLMKEVREYRRENKVLLERLDEIVELSKKKNIKTFEELAQQDKEAAAHLIKLAKQTVPMRMNGKVICVIGNTSTGKSTIINRFLNAEVAKTGYGETTTEVTSYQGTGFTLIDFPGRNDEISYFSMEYISVFKGSSKILIVIQTTVGENSSLMKLLDAIGVNYDIVFNKFDLVPDDEKENVKNQILSQIRSLGIQRVKKLYLVSAKNPRMFPDWLQLVNNSLE